jgi:phosphohistidine phosphatase
VGTRRLTLLRHGKAEAVDAYPEDYERPLTHRGSIEAQEMASRLVKRNLVPDLILVSPAERAWATAEIIATACELDAKQVQCARELYLATAERTWQLLAHRAASLSHIMICGHNPGLSLIASRFGPKAVRRELPTAGIATAVWYHADWATLQPETADNCEMDDPEDMDESWEWSG